MQTRKANKQGGTNPRLRNLGSYSSDLNTPIYRTKTFKKYRVIFQLNKELDKLMRSDLSRMREFFVGALTHIGNIAFVVVFCVVLTP